MQEVLPLPFSQEPVDTRQKEAATAATAAAYHFGDLRVLTILEMVGLFTLAGPQGFTGIEPVRGGPCGY